jgi:beta-glucanase (GH16 family)
LGNQLDNPAGSTQYGTFETKFKAGKGNGVVTSFFLNMDEGPQGNFQTSDAIALEIFGHNSSFIHYHSIIDKVRSFRFHR